MSEAYLGLSRTSQAPAAAIDHIEAWLGFLEIEMGRLELGRLRLKQAYHRSQEWSEADFKRWPKRRELLQHLIKSLWHFSLFYDGSIDFWDLYNTPLMQIYKGAVASLAVCWTRDEKALRATMELHQSQASKGESHTSNDMGYRWLKPLIEALRGKTNKKPESLKKRPKLEFSPNLLDSVMEAETFVIAKKNTLAKKALLKNEASMGALHGAPSPLVIRAVHYRNVLEVFQKTTTKAEQQVYENAQTFFRIHKNAGYRFLDTSHF